MKHKILSWTFYDLESTYGNVAWIANWVGGVIEVYATRYGLREEPMYYVRPLMAEFSTLEAAKAACQLHADHVMTVWAFPKKKKRKK